MSVRPHPSKGAGWWYIEYRPQGRRGKLRRIPYQGTELAARKWEGELRRESRADRLPELHPTLAQVIPDFMRHYRQEHLPGGVERTVRSIKWLLPHFGKLKFPAITPTSVTDYKTKRLAAGVTPSTVNKELAALSSLCRWAADNGYCQPIKIRRFPPKLTKGRSPEVLTEDEVRRFLAALLPGKYGFFCALYFAGLRSGEAKGLTAGGVFLDRGVLVVRGKGNKERVVPIVDQLAVILREAVQDRPTGPLFPAPKDLRETIKWAAKRAGIAKRITPHTFRHCFGTHATMAGVSLRSLQEIMGHSSSAVTEVYSRLASQALTTEIKKFGERLTLNQANSK